MQLQEKAPHHVGKGLEVLQGLWELLVASPPVSVSSNCTETKREQNYNEQCGDGGCNYARSAKD